MNSEFERELFAGVDAAALERAHITISGLTPGLVEQWARKYTSVYEIDSRRFRMGVDPGENADHVIIFGGEYANGANAYGAVARLLTIRTMVDQEATIIYQSNSTSSEDNLNFSSDERKRLASGNPSPLIDRMRIVLEKSGSAQTITGFGPSQGGTAILALGSHPNVQPIQAAVIETPNVVSRTSSQLMLQFTRSGDKLKQNIAANFDPDNPLYQKLMAEFTLSGTVKFLLGGLRRDNLALVGLMRRNTAAQQMNQILARGGSVMHAWATADAVSPAAANRLIADNPLFRNRPRYASAVLDNDHSVTNLYLESAAAVYRAVKLARP